MANFPSESDSDDSTADGAGRTPRGTNLFALRRAKELRDLAEDWAIEKQRAEAILRDVSPRRPGERLEKLATHLIPNPC